MTQFPFEILCPHELDPSILIKTRLPDYHPLTAQEIASLLDFAKAHQNDGVAVSKVQVRLNQGVPGRTCPRTIHGYNAQQSTELDRVFVDRYKEGGTPDVVKNIEFFTKE